MNGPGQQLLRYVKDFIRIKSGLAGLIILIILLIFTGVALSYPAKVYQEWKNPSAWEMYPPHAPPSWLSIFFPKEYFTNEQVLSLKTSQVQVSGLYVTYIYFNFTWDKALPPEDVYFIVLTNVTPSSEAVYWTKPDGKSINLNVPSTSYNTPFDVISLKGQILSYMSSYGRSPTTVNSQVLTSALFNSPQSNFTQVEDGNYRVEVVVVSNGPVAVKQAKLELIGDSYGLMGTDVFGRPISLGVLLGLPSALDVGILTSVVSVVVGVLVGGISGYLGGRKDSVIQWVVLVFLALPALPFLVALSIVIQPTLELEALLIAMLSWPFYAIIARSTALSIKSNAYVEADKLLGIPSYRVFFTHFMPRLIPMTVAYMALGVPGGILLSETLAFLGLEPANVVTWGQMLNEAETYQAQVNGWWWWVVFPGLMIVVVSVPFVLIGFAIERLALGER